MVVPSTAAPSPFNRLRSVVENGWDRGNRQAQSAPEPCDRAGCVADMDRRRACSRDSDTPRIAPRLGCTSIREVVKGCEVCWNVKVARKVVSLSRNDYDTDMKDGSYVLSACKE